MGGETVNYQASPDGAECMQREGSDFKPETDCKGIVEDEWCRSEVMQKTLTKAGKTCAEEDKKINSLKCRVGRKKDGSRCDYGSYGCSAVKCCAEGEAVAF